MRLFHSTPEDPRRSQRHWFILVVFTLLIGAGYLYLVDREPQAVTKEETSGAPGNLSVETNPSGATIRVDRKSYETPILLEGLRAGTYQVEISLSGYQPEKRSIVIRPKQTASIQVTLRK